MNALATPRAYFSKCSWGRSMVSTTVTEERALIMVKTLSAEFDTV